VRLVFHYLVQREVNDAVRWYEDQSEGLGNDFFSKLAAALRMIADRPESFGFWLGSGKIRRIKLQRFPYAVLFEVFPDRVRVLCVRHDKQHPSYGLRRT